MLTVFVLILRGRRSWSLPTLLGASAAEPLVQLLRCGQLHLCQGSGSVSCSLSSGSCWSATVGTVPPPTQALLFARPAVWASRRVRAFLRRLSSVLPPFCNQKERCIPPPLHSHSPGAVSSTLVPILPPGCPAHRIAFAIAGFLDTCQFKPMPALEQSHLCTELP